ncbi:hypothetical protein HU200_056657 [Digitaria exilis]|uniref:Uncharacterized protein n=1 Tax=Digitaria exilis TaxID=1010633 RepID=A0A835ALR2_9POAL|nr:hypothetical protein HU200_056657 [Digitaria exilis]
MFDSERGSGTLPHGNVDERALQQLAHLLREPLHRGAGQAHRYSDAQFLAPVVRARSPPTSAGPPYTGLPHPKSRWAAGAFLTSDTTYVRLNERGGRPRSTTRSATDRMYSMFNFSFACFTSSTA